MSGETSNIGGNAKEFILVKDSDRTEGPVRKSEQDLRIYEPGELTARILQEDKMVHTLDLEHKQMPNDVVGIETMVACEDKNNEAPNLVIEEEKVTCHQKGELSSPKCLLNIYHDSSCNSVKMLLDDMISVQMVLDLGAEGKYGRSDIPVLQPCAHPICRHENKKGQRSVTW